MKNLQEFAVKDMSNVVGGGTICISGVLDGIKGNTTIRIDAEAPQTV